MDAEAEFWPADVKSIAIAEMSAPPPPPSRFAKQKPPFLARLVTYVKLGLVVWGLISLGGAVGVAAYYLHGPSATPLLASQDDPVRPAVATAPAKERLASLIDLPETPPEALQQFRLPAPRVQPAGQPMLAPPPITPAGPVAETRLPRSRPDEPITTGSIAPAPAPEPVWVDRPRRSRLDPCRALRKLGAPYLFGNRCGHYTRVDPPLRQLQRITGAPPPAHDYAPRPYQPPVVAQD